MVMHASEDARRNHRAIGEWYPAEAAEEEEFDMTDHSVHGTGQAQRAEHFLQLHKTGSPLILANVWDAGSAHMVAAAGASAVATSSGAVSWAHGVQDGSNLDLNTVRVALREIVGAVGDLPVTADIEGGYAQTPEGVGASVAAVIEAGVVGINIEDSGAPADSSAAPLYTAADQAARIAAAREAAQRAGIRLFINVRTDVFLFGVGAEAGRYDDVVARAQAYSDAGADGLFVPGLLDLDVLSRISQSTDLALNAMWLPGAPSPAELSKAGVARVSVGTALFQTTYTHVQRVAAKLFNEGSYADLEDALSFGDFNDAFQVASHDKD
jgi:2-methylisocitrate lyase-like PEP mutase family enzyme